MGAEVEEARAQVQEKDAVFNHLREEQEGHLLQIRELQGVVADLHRDLDAARGEIARLSRFVGSCVWTYASEVRAFCVRVDLRLICSSWHVVKRHRPVRSFPFPILHVINS